MDIKNDIIDTYESLLSFLISNRNIHTYSQ